MADDHDRVESGLRVKLRIYLAILTVALVLVTIDALRIGAESTAAIAVGLGAGLLLGIIASRMSALSWDAMNARVVGRIDTVGSVILVGYVLIVIFRGSVLAELFDPRLAGTASLATLAGLMLGQVVGTVGGIARVIRVALTEQAAGSTER